MYIAVSSTTEDTDSTMAGRTHGEQMHDHGLAHAQGLLKEGCLVLGIDPDTLRLRKANDEEKVMLAELISARTSVPLDWFCQSLGMGSRSHCSRLINTQRRKLLTDPALKRRRDRLLKKAIYND